MGPHHRALLPIRRRYALVAVLEGAGIQAGLVGRRCAAYPHLRRGLLFFHAGGRSGDRPPRHRDLCGLWNGPDRACICGPRSGAKCRFYSAGRRIFRRSRRNWQKRDQRPVAREHRRRNDRASRQLKQAQTDLKAAAERAKLPLPSEELLKVAEDNLHRLEQVVASGNVPAVEYEKAKSEANRLRGALENERIERDRNLQALDETRKKLESQMRNSEIRGPMDGLLSAVSTIDGELVAEGNQLFTISSRKTYVRGEVNEEDVGEVKPGMKAKVQLYAYRTQAFAARVSSIQPAADPDTQRYTVILEMEKPPDNLMAGMTGEMNIITGTHENALLVPTRALLVDQALVVKRGIVQRRTIKVGFRTLDFAEALSGVSLGDRVVIADQDRLHSGQPVRQRRVDISNK